MNVFMVLAESEGRADFDSMRFVRAADPSRAAAAWDMARRDGAIFSPFIMIERCTVLVIPVPQEGMSREGIVDIKPGIAQRFDPEDIRLQEAIGDLMQALDFA